MATRPIKPPTRDLLRHGLVLLVVALGVWLGCAALLGLHLAHEGDCIPRKAPWIWGLTIALAGGVVASAGAFWSRLSSLIANVRPELSGGLFRLLLYCVVGVWMAYLVGCGKGEPVTVLCASALSLGVYSLALIIGSRAGARLNRPAVRVVDVVLFNLCVLVILSELGMRFVARHSPSVLFARPSAGVVERIEASRYAPGTVRHGSTVNSGGHYDDEFVPKAPGQSLAIAIGDSFSAGVVPHHYHFTTVAERRLDGAAVYNMGFPAIDVLEYSHLLVTEALPLKPDVVVINLFVGNDLTYAWPDDDGCGFLCSWFDRRNVLVFQVPRRLVVISRQGRAGRAAIEDRSAAGGGESIARTLDEITERFPWVVDPRAERPTFSSREFLRIERNRFQRLATQSVEGFNRRLAPLLEMRRIAHPTPVLVMLIPDVFQVEDRLWREIKPADATAKERMRGVRVAREWLGRMEFPTLDLLPVMRNVPPMEDGERHLYHLQDTHLNARGNRVVGEALADFVRPHLGNHPPPRQ